MKEWMKVRTNKALFVLAVCSFAVIALEGVLYYASYPDVFFRFLLILQNIIKAFTFKATISLENARSFMMEDPTPFKTVLGYLYMIGVFTAPYCTIATVYKLLERALKFAFWLRGKDDARPIVIFGYNDTVRQLLKSADGKQRVHVVCGKEPPAEERYRMTRRNIKLHTFDLTKAEDAEVEKLLQELEIGRAAYVLLFEDTSVRNFSLLQALASSSRGLTKDSKVFCRCEEEGIGRLIENYYDKTVSKEEARRFDFEIIDLPQLQVRSMFRDVPLHSYWMKAPEETSRDPEKWRVHLLILGFGKVGQQALLQAMNLGVTHSGNPMVIDVIEQKEENRDLFFNHFSPDAFREREDEPGVYDMAGNWADGQLTLRFHQINVRYGAFRKLLPVITKEPAGAFTYVVSAIDQPDTGIHCLTELWRFLRSAEKERGRDVPILVRMDSDLRLQNYLKNDEAGSMIESVSVIRPPEEILTLSNLFEAETDTSAKQCNAYYAKMTFEAKGGAGPQTEQEVQDSWNGLTLFRRNANRAAAYHNTVLSDVLDCSLGEGKTAALQPLFEGASPLIRWEDGIWHYTKTDGEFIEQVTRPEQAFAREMLKTEHRRWCYYTASIGWEPPAENGRTVTKRDDLQINPCLVSWDELLEVQPHTVKYDLMPLMAEYEKIKA